MDNSKRSRNYDYYDDSSDSDYSLDDESMDELLLSGDLFSDRPLPPGRVHPIFKFLLRAKDNHPLLPLMSVCGNPFRDETSNIVKPPRKKRGPSGILCQDTGVYERLDPKDSVWWNWYVKTKNGSDIILNEEVNPRLAQKFRWRFGLPHNKYIELYNNSKGWFGSYGKPDATGTVRTHVQLLMLGSLRHLRRGDVFDNFEELSYISAETHRKFAKVFYQQIRIRMGPEMIRWPQTPEEIHACREPFTLGGLDGCIGSTDATTVILEKVKADQKNLNSGWKEKHCVRNFNLTCNHRRRILNTTSGVPGRWPDKTTQKFDEFINELHNGTLYKNEEYTYYTLDGVEKKGLGLWLLCDNGYIHWPCMIPPYKDEDAINRRQTIWSHFVESMRKDVECTFGILKGRWRILCSGIRSYVSEQTLHAVDDIWFTCCILHNWLLDIDGLDDMWNMNVSEQAEFEMEETKSRNFGVIPKNIVHRLRNPRSGGNDKDIDTTSIGCKRAQCIEDIDIFDNNYGVNSSNLPPFNEMRNRLVDSWNFLWNNHRIRWVGPKKKDN